MPTETKGWDRNQMAARAAQEGASATVRAARTGANAQAEAIRSVQALRNKDHAEFLGNLRQEEREAKRSAAAVADERKRQARAAAAL